MVEIDCEPITGRGKPIHAKIEKGGYCKVSWGNAYFEFPYALIDGILENVFVGSDWQPLGSYRDYPKGLGKYIRDQTICSLHSPQFASAIAPIMIKLNLIESRPSKTIQNGIELKRSIRLP